MMTMSLAPAELPAGQRVYAVGDVHGCADRLAMMHRLIADDLAARPIGDVTVIHLGDYIDRGTDSAGVLDRLLTAWSAPGPAAPPPAAPPPATTAPRMIHLMGNHEEMMLAALDVGDADTVLQWLSNGGADTLASWGVPRRAKPRDWPRTIPAAHIRLLRGLTLHHRQGGYLFVHAGLRPGVPLERQSRHDMLWIREPFLSWQGELPGVVVHGHTPEHDVVRRANRIGVDTGAVMGGVLTCVVLEEDRMGLLRA
jgi:serine/threonine protein phosphatase 1